MLTNSLVGEIAYLNVVDQEVRILNSSKAAVNPLDKRSSIYSNRPVRMMASEIIGCKKTLVIMQYGSRFREIRKCTNRSMGTRAYVEKFAPLLEKETVKLLVGVTADPGFLAQHIRK